MSDAPGAEECARLREEIQSLKENLSARIAGARNVTPPPIYFSNPRVPQSDTTQLKSRSYSSEMEDLRARLEAKEVETSQLKDRLQRQSGRHSNVLHLKLPVYSGSTDIDEYLSQFIAICEFEGWDDEEAAIILLAKLQGDALSVAAALDDQTLRSLTTNLRRHFAQDQEEVATLKLHGRAQKKDETFEEKVIIYSTPQALINEMK